MLKKFIQTFAATAILCTGMIEANAGKRYATPPPLTLSPDLSSPWTLQVSPPKRRASRAERKQAKRPAGLRRLRKQTYNGVRTRKRKQSSIVTATYRRPAKPSIVQPSLRPKVVSYSGEASPGTVIINTIERRLYLVLPNGKARKYAVGVGKPGFEWAGSHKVTRKTEWPSWTPPKEMIVRERAKGRELPNFMPGGPENPMGARALYLGSTLYRIHGTNQDWSIGKAVSSGCIRMRNVDVMDLYDRVPVGARVKVI